MYERVKTIAKKPEIKPSKTNQVKKSNNSSALDHILFLHQTIGNQAVQGLFKAGIIQAKLKIGKPNDIYEKEADRMAEKIMRMPEPTSTCAEGTCEEEKIIQPKSLADKITPLVQRQGAEEEEKEEKEEETIQTKQISNYIPEVTQDLESRINSLRGGGQPLPEPVRSFFEPRFDYDFSQVRIHHNTESARLARQLNAQAFTYGRDIFFGAGRYNPNTFSGKRLLAYELTHVVQGERNSHMLQKKETENVSQKQLCDMNGKIIYTGTKEEIINNIKRDISTLPNIVRNNKPYVGLGNKFENYCAFLISMPRYIDNPIQHFKKIRKANVPGNVYLHDTAAKRLEEVKELLKGEMPATTVAFALRGRYKPHLRKSKSMMAHPLGYAVDYRAIKNPMITDKKLVKLIEIITGESISINLGLRYSKRREKIKECGRIKIENLEDVNKCNKIMFKKLEAEYYRLSQASKAFQSIAGEALFQCVDLESMATELRSLKRKIRKKDKRLNGLESTLKRLQNRNKNTKNLEESIINLRKQKLELEKKKKHLEDNISEILEGIRQSMLAKIRKRKALIQPQLNIYKRLFGNLPSHKELDKKEKIFRSQKAKTERSLKNLHRKINRTQKKYSALKKWISGRRKRKESLIKKINKLQSRIDSLRREYLISQDELSRLEHKLKYIHIKKELDVLTDLEDNIKNLAPEIAEKRKAKNPAIWQLVELGYFNPDPERPQNIAPNPSKYGFNYLFIRAMMKRGFDWGATWSPGSTDPMHFELVEGVDSIKRPKKVAISSLPACSLKMCKELSKIEKSR